jgi:hypothetical protein
MHICDLDASSAGTLGYKVPHRWGFTYANFSINLTESCFVKLDIVNINGEFSLFLIADITSINYSYISSSITTSEHVLQQGSDKF